MSRAKKARTQRRSRNQPSSAKDNSQQLQKAMNWVISQQSFKDLDFHGNTSWQPADLVVLTLLWILSLYEQRWGVELEFRALKQTFERRTLRSRRSDRALVEMEWSLFGMTVIELFALHEQLQAKRADPKALSFAASLRAVRCTLQHLHYRPDHVSDFKTLLRGATLDEYERKGSKSARYKQQKKDKPSCGVPKVSRATAQHREKLKLLSLQNAA